MQRTSQTFRALAALALVLSLVAGLFAVRGASAQDATPVVEPVVSAEPAATEEPVDPADIDGDAGTDTGTDSGADSDSIYTIATDIIELRARLEAGLGNQGTTVFELGEDSNIEIDAVGDSLPLSGATFEVRVSGTNDLIDAVTTGANGLIYLDAPVNTTFYILDTGTGSTSDDLFIDDPEGDRGVVTATRYANDADVPDSGNTAYPIAQDAIELRSVVVECPANETGVTYFTEGDPSNDDFVGCTGDEDSELSAAQLNDSTPASLEFGVFVSDTNELIDTVTTDEGGIGLLDAPIGVDFVVRDLTTLDEYETFIEDASEGRILITAARTIPVEPGANVGPDGDTLPYPIATDFLELRARYFQDPSLDGTTEYDTDYDNGTQDFTNGESIPAAGVEFTVIDDQGRVVDRGVTDEDGVVLLDAPLTDDSDVDNYFIIDSVNGDPSSLDYQLTEYVDESRQIVAATIYVADLDDVASGVPSASADASGSAVASDSPAASASVVASASASTAPSFPPFEGEVIEGGAVITGTISEDDELAGTYEYYYDLVDTQATGDIRYAGEGEQYYYVAVVDGDGDLLIVDEGATDANGMVTLDIPADEPYFIFEEDDFNDPYGSDLIAAGQPASFFVVEYVAGADASVAPSAAPSTGGGDDNGTDNGGTDGGSTGGGNAAGGGATALPNTGAGANDAGMSMTWALFALMAVAGVAAAGFGLRRRNV